MNLLSQNKRKLLMSRRMNHRRPPPQMLQSGLQCRDLTITFLTKVTVTRTSMRSWISQTTRKPTTISIYWGIHVISPYFGGTSLYFVYFPENLPTKIFRISYISYTSPYLEFQISLPNFKNSLLCLIILPIWETKSPYLSSGMYHMYVLGDLENFFDKKE